MLEIVIVLVKMMRRCWFPLMTPYPPFASEIALWNAIVMLFLYRGICKGVLIIGRSDVLYGWTHIDGGRSRSLQITAFTCLVHYSSSCGGGSSNNISLRKLTESKRKYVRYWSGHKMSTLLLKETFRDDWCIVENAYTVFRISGALRGGV